MIYISTGKNLFIIVLIFSFPDLARPANRKRSRYVDILCFNTAFGGAAVNEGNAKIRMAVVDFASRNKNHWHIIGFQELYDKKKSNSIARKLNGVTGRRWKYTINGGCTIMTDGEIRSKLIAGDLKNPNNVGAMLSFNGDRQNILVWNLHLTSYPYGPYMLCANASIERVLIHEQKTHVKEFMDIYFHKTFEQTINSNMKPVILLGDFNTPSHEDALALDPGYESETENCRRRRKVRWPLSFQLVKYGFTDAFREKYSATQIPGNTWSPVIKSNPRAGFEPQDRIDMIWYRNPKMIPNNPQYHNVLQICQTNRQFPFVETGQRWRTRGIKTAEANVSSHRENEWPSDHAAVYCQFRLDC